MTLEQQREEIKARPEFKECVDMVARIYRGRWICQRRKHCLGGKGPDIPALYERWPELILRAHFIATDPSKKSFNKLSEKISRLVYVIALPPIEVPLNLMKLCETVPEAHIVGETKDMRLWFIDRSRLAENTSEPDIDDCGSPNLTRCKS